LQRRSACGLPLAAVKVEGGGGLLDVIGDRVIRALFFAILRFAVFGVGGAC